MKDNKKIIQIMVIFTIIFTVMGGTLAYWTWTTSNEQKTNIVFTSTAGFSCAADGGGNITHTDVSLAPTSCTDTTRTIKREVTPYVEINRDNINIKLNLWLKVNTLGSGLATSDNFRYVLTTSSTSCSEGTILSSGNFKGLSTGDTVDILNNKVYSSTTTDKYYLYIWLDAEETSSSTMNQKFNFSLGGECTDTPQPEKPVLDTNGMIPVKIDENGDVFTVSENDASWYSYENQEWANAVLVNNASRNNYLNNLSNNVQVEEDDILAYYVWIPRYKYRIPSPGKCSSLEEHSLITTPECYAPYTIPDSDKPNIITFIYMIVQSLDFVDYTQEMAANDLDDALKTGWLSVEIAGLFLSLTEAIGLYNSETGTDVILESNFNENNILSQSTPRTIDIIFESKESEKSMGDAVNTYYTHPAFTWDGEAISGIWVGKFETTPEKNSECYSNPYYDTCNNSIQNYTVLPNESSLRHQTVSNMFFTSQNLTKTNNVYGLTNDTTDGHMMKNSEWGAVAYLSHSIYGINADVVYNNSNRYITGCGTSTGDDTICEDAYGTDGLLEYPQSTTNNITGIFDMGGGAIEFVMGHYGIEITEFDYSGFSTLPESKHYNFYTSASCTLETCGGHGINETLRWYQQFWRSVSLTNPWLTRNNLFEGNAVKGGGDLSQSWRSVLVVTSGA